MWGSFCWLGRWRFFEACGFALFWWAGEQGSVNIARAEIDPPSSVAYGASFPPRGSLLEILSVFTTRLTKCGGRARFVCGARSDITPYTSAGLSIVGNDPCVVPFQLKVTCRSVLCYGRRRLIPPHQSLSRQLPPEGKPFCESLFALHDKMMRADRKGKPQCKAIFTMFAQRTEGFPSGGSWRRRRLMRGDKSALSIGMYLSPQTARPAYRSARPAHKTCAKPHSTTSPHLPDKRKTSPQNPATAKSETNYRSCNGGVLWGSSR